MTYLFAIYSLKRYAKLNELKLSCLTFPSRFRKIIILVIEDNHFVINLSSKSSYLAFLSVSIHIKLIHKKQIYFLPLSLSLSMSLFIYIIFLLFAFTFYCCNSFSGFYPSALPGSGYIPIFFVYRLCPFVSSFGFPAFAFLSIWVPSFFFVYYYFVEPSKTTTIDWLFLSLLVPPPRQLTLERQLNKSILIGWNHPEGSPPESLHISCYHVYVDGILRTTVRAGDRCRALIEGVDSSKVSHFLKYIFHLKMRTVNQVDLMDSASPDQRPFGNSASSSVTGCGVYDGHREGSAVRPDLCPGESRDGHIGPDQLATGQLELPARRLRQPRRGTDG